MQWRKLSIQALIIAGTILVTLWVVHGPVLVTNAAAQQATSTEGLDLSLSLLKNKTTSASIKNQTGRL